MKTKLHYGAEPKHVIAQESAGSQKSFACENPKLISITIRKLQGILSSCEDYTKQICCE